MRGVVLAGGTGSRLHPLTQITNKHLLPVGPKPMVLYSLEALVDAGITEVMVVTGGAHAGEFIRLLGSGHSLGLKILTYAYQERPGGIADALRLAQGFVLADRAVVVLADNIFEKSIAPSVERFRSQQKGARILLAPVEEPAHLQHLGVPRLVGSRIEEIIEKPTDPPSNFAVTGVYMYESDVFDVIGGVSVSRRGELEISDVNNWYVARGLMEYDIIDGYWGDAGESIDAYYAVNDFVRSRAARI